MIPRVFHRLWVGPPMPETLAAYGATWERHHPDWAHVLWTEATIPALVNQRLYDEADRIAPRNVGQLRADIARYEILLHHGGVWIDTDMECLRPIDPLLVDVTCFAAWEQPGRWVNNAVLGAEPGHPFLAELVERLEHNVVANPGKRPNILTGPQYLTPIYRRHADTVAVFEKDVFYPYLFDELDRASDEFPKSYGIHHWANRRRQRDVPLPALRGGST